MSDEGILEIADCCKKLTELHVSSCYGVTDKSVAALAKYCPSLRELDVSWCFQVTDQSLQQFLVLNCNLQSIRIKNCAKVRPDFDFICILLSISNSALISRIPGPKS